MEYVLEESTISVFLNFTFNVYCFCNCLWKLNFIAHQTNCGCVAFSVCFYFSWISTVWNNKLYGIQQVVLHSCSSFSLSLWHKPLKYFQTHISHNFHWDVFNTLLHIKHLTSWEYLRYRSKGCKCNPRYGRHRNMLSQMSLSKSFQPLVTLENCSCNKYINERKWGCVGVMIYLCCAQGCKINPQCGDYVQRFILNLTDNFDYELNDTNLFG